MKKFLFLLTIITLSLQTPLMAQNLEKDIKKASKKAEKEAKKAAKEAEKQALYAEAAKALTDRKFIVKIDRVQIDNGRFNHVDNRGSFFELNDTATASQIDGGSKAWSPKLVYGTASDFKTSTDKKGNVSFELTLKEKTSITPKNVKIRLETMSNECSMVIQSKKGMRVYTRGVLEPIGKTKMFKGAPVVF